MALKETLEFLLKIYSTEYMRDVFEEIQYNTASACMPASPFIVYDLYPAFLRAIKKQHPRTDDLQRLPIFQSLCDLDLQEYPQQCSQAIRLYSTELVCAKKNTAPSLPQNSIRRALFQVPF